MSMKTSRKRAAKREMRIRELHRALWGAVEDNYRELTNAAEEECAERRRVGNIWPTCFEWEVWEVSRTIDDFLRAEAENIHYGRRVLEYIPPGINLVVNGELHQCVNALVKELRG